MVPSSVRTPLAVCTNMSSTVAAGAVGIGTPSRGAADIRRWPLGSLLCVPLSLLEPGSRGIIPFGSNFARPAGRQISRHSNAQTATLGQSHTGERRQAVHQLILESRVASLRCGRLPLPVVPVAAAHGGGRVIADGQPRLGAISLLQVAGRAGAAHFGRDPARIDD